MTELLDADSLAMLADGFEAAMTASDGPAASARAVFDLGWGELLDASPTQGAAMAFTALGTTGSAAGLLDDVLMRALGLAASPTTCVVLAPPQTARVPGRLVGDRVAVDGLVSARVDTADDAMLVFATGDDVGWVTLDAALVRSDRVDGVDPGLAYRRVAVEIPATSLTPLTVAGTWDAAVDAARVALAHQLIGGARWMLAEARQHAVDRVQFGQPIGGFQAIRHKLADSLVAIEGAASIAAACTADSDPLLAALAKSHAGAAAKTTAKHAQQVLAGVGFTTDHAFHRWLKRTLVIDTLFGSATSLPTEIGQQLLARRSAPRLIEL